MSLIKVANVLLEGTKQFYEVPSLYVRADAPVAPVEGAQDGAWELRGPGTFDFSTYFNALSVAKLREYTVARDFTLHLELMGAACTVTPTHGDSYSVEPLPVEKGRVELAASNEWRVIDLAVEAAPTDIVASFVICAEGPVRIRRSAYFTEVDDAHVHPVELALATTTFRREDYIKRNVALLKERILNSDEDAAGHFSIHVVDNGRTLDAADIEGPRVHLHPNPNVGGSGGFARGMICALHQDPPATHVLLMDDDVSVSPESVLRTYALLRLVKDEYAEAFVGGAMMERENPGFCFEQGGFWMRNGSSMSLRPRTGVESFPAVVEGECWHTNPQVKGFEDQAQTYAAWWFCAIPLSVVRKEGLPLPIFVRFDDMEYALRCKRPIMTMNGICVWHDAFAWRYNYVQERYQSVRNALIVQATTGVGELSDIVGPVAGLFFERDICLFNYGAAELVLEAFEDFMAGPEVTLAPGFGEKRFLGLNRAGEKLRPVDEVSSELRERYGIELPAMTTFEVDSDVAWSPEEVDWFVRTKNGQLPLPAPEPPRVTGVRSFIAHVKATSEKPAEPCVPPAPRGWVDESTLPSMGVSANGSVRWAVIDARGGVQQFAKSYDRDVLVALSPTAHTGAIRVRDAARACELVERYEADLRALNERREELRAAYSAVRAQVTSEEWWLEYLKNCLG